MSARFVKIPISPRTMEILAAHGFDRHIRMAPDDTIYLPILESMFEECKKQQRPDETIEDVIVRALQNGVTFQ